MQYGLSIFSILPNKKQQEKIYVYQSSAKKKNEHGICNRATRKKKQHGKLIDPVRIIEHFSEEMGTRFPRRIREENTL